MPRTVILAGGFGTRIRHLLRDLPKPMAPVAGLPFCEWVMRWALHHGLTEFTLSTGHLAELIESHFAPQPIAGATIGWARETTPLGTAGGFLNCVETSTQPTDGRWLVANGDSLVLADPRPLLSLLDREDTVAAVLGLRVPDAGRYGSLDIAPDGRLLAFREKVPGAGIINAGIYAFRSEALALMPAKRPLSFEVDVFPSLIALGKVRALSVEAPFIDIGTPETLPAATAFIQAHPQHFTRPSP